MSIIRIGYNYYSTLHHHSPSPSGVIVPQRQQAHVEKKNIHPTVKKVWSKQLLDRFRALPKCLKVRGSIVCKYIVHCAVTTVYTWEKGSCRGVVGGSGGYGGITLRDLVRLALFVRVDRKARQIHG